MQVRLHLINWRDWRPNFFWLSLLFHVLIFSLLFFLRGFESKKIEVNIEEKQTESGYYYVPAYRASSATFPQVQKSQNQNEELENKRQSGIKELPPPDLSGIPLRESPKEFFKKIAKLEENSLTAIAMPNETKNQDPVHLIGEKLLEDPLQLLLGRAITPRLYYPSIARDLRARGRVTLDMVLYPDGNMLNVRVIQSSRSASLDAAALNAVKSASPVANVNLYVKQPKYLVINIIY